MEVSEHSLMSRLGISNVAYLPLHTFTAKAITLKEITREAVALVATNGVDANLGAVSFVELTFINIKAVSANKLVLLLLNHAGAVISLPAIVNTNGVWMVLLTIGNSDSDLKRVRHRISLHYIQHTHQDLPIGTTQ